MIRKILPAVACAAMLSSTPALASGEIILADVPSYDVQGHCAILQDVPLENCVQVEMRSFAAVMQSWDYTNYDVRIKCDRVASSVRGSYLVLSTCLQQSKISV